MLLGLVDSGSPDLSGLATKQELENAITQIETDLAPVDEVTLDNMQSITSNAVAVANSYSTTEHFTGSYWIDGKKIYKKVVDCGSSNSRTSIQHNISNIDTVCFWFGYMTLENNSIYYPLPWRDHDTPYHYCELYVDKNKINKVVSNSWNGACYAIIFYTKTTD